MTITHGQHSYTFHPYYCHTCNYEYVKMGSMINHHLYRMIGDRMFRWSHEETTNVARVWYIGSPGIPGVSPNKDLELLQSFEDNLPIVTPDNVEDKIRLVVTFR